MANYVVTIKGARLFCGTLDECFSHLVHAVGDAPLKTLYDAGFRIEVIYE